MDLNFSLYSSNLSQNKIYNNKFKPFRIKKNNQ